MRTAPPPLFLLLLLPFLATATSAAYDGFRCSWNSSTTCLSLVGFQPATSTTYANVSSTFQVPLISILGANGLSLSTSDGTAVQNGSTVRIPIPCRCANGIGWSDRTPVYTIQPNDTLYKITLNWFGKLTTYQEIGKANNLPDVDKVEVGEKLWIPLPCSCGKEVVHLAHRVASGSSMAGIAEMFGTNESTLLDLNGMADAKELTADQILDVPLRACSSSISNESVDYGLRLANGSYAITAGGCVTCSCSSSTYRLECLQSTSQGSTRCPALTPCEGTSSFIGNSTRTSDGCEEYCAYAGYKNATALISIMTTNATVNCESGGSELRGFQWSAVALVSLLMIWNIS